MLDEQAGFEPVIMQMSGGHLLSPVQTLVTTIIFAMGEKVNQIPLTPPKNLLNRLVEEIFCCERLTKSSVNMGKKA